jgi:hypothetical protein
MLCAMFKKNTNLKSVLFALLFVMGSSSCREHQTHAMFIHFNMAFTQATTACTLNKASLDSQFLPWGVLDLDLSNNYMMMPLIENRLPSSLLLGSPTSLSTENNLVSMTGVYISYRVSDDLTVELADGSQAALGSRPELADNFAQLPGSMNPTDLRVWELAAIPPPVGNALNNATGLRDKYATSEVLVDIKFEGTLVDGSIVYSNVFTYPIWVCRGCLTYNPGVNCSILDDTVTGPCRFGQDEGVDCRLCSQLTGDPERCDPGKIDVGGIE